MITRRKFLKHASGLLVPAAIAFPGIVRASSFFMPSQVASWTRPTSGGGSITPPTADSNLWGWWSTDTNLTISDNGTIKYLATGANYWTSRGGGGLVSGLTPQWGDTCGNVVKIYDGVYTSSGLPSGKPCFHLDTGESIGGSAAGALGMRNGGACSFSQPVSIFLLARFSSWGDGHFAIDLGNNANEIAQRTSSPNIGLYAGSAVTALTSCSLSTWHVLTAIYHGSSSSLQVDNNTAATGNPGANSSNGPALGIYSLSCGTANTMVGDIAAVIICTAASDSTAQAIHKNWLANYGGITI